MVGAVSIIALLVVAVLLERRFRDSSRAPRSCCSNRPWPPDEPVGRAGVTVSAL